MKTLIKNATVVFPDESTQVNLLIEDERIADIDPAPQLAVERTIDARGLHLLPGVIDDQVHFREPGLDQLFASVRTQVICHHYAAIMPAYFRSVYYRRQTDA